VIGIVRPVVVEVELVVVPVPVERVVELAIGIRIFALLHPNFGKEKYSNPIPKASQGKSCGT